MGTTTPFSKGQKLGEISADALNRQHDFTTRPKIAPLVHQANAHPQSANNIIVGLNYTGKDLSPGDVVRVSEMASQQEDVFGNQIYAFIEPKLELNPETYEKYEYPTFAVAIIRSGGSNGDMVYASVYGREVARIKVEDYKHHYATVEDGETYLISSEEGPFVLLGVCWHTGMVYWPVVFPVGGVLTPEEEEEEPEEPDEEELPLMNFPFSIGVVTGPGSNTGQIAFRYVENYDSKKNKINIGEREDFAYVWPEDFNLFPSEDE